MLASFQALSPADVAVACHGNKAVVALAYSFDGRLVVTAGADAKACVVSAETGATVAELEGAHAEGLNDVCWVDERLVVTASDDNTLVLWDASYGKAVTTFKGHSNYVYCVTCNPVNRAIYSGGFDGNIMVFDAASGACRLAFDAHADAVCAIDYSPAGDGCFLTGSHDGLVRVWDASSVSGCLLTIHNEARPPVASASYSANGRYVLVSTLDSTHRLFHCPGGEAASLVDTYRAHVTAKYSVQSRLARHRREGGGDGGSYVVSGSEDGKVYLWDVNGTETICDGHGGNGGAVALEGHGDAVLAVAAHPDPDVMQLASAGRDGSVKIWGMDGSKNSSSSGSSVHQRN